MDTFSPPIAPTPGGLSHQVTPRVLSAPFGDGYRQDAGDGLNAILRTVTLQWSVLDPADADTIEAFFVAEKGYLPFLWTDPRESAPRQWKCTTWTRAAATAATDSISATFVEVHDL